MANPSQSLVQAPNFVGVINQNVFIEPLGGASSPASYLDAWPDTVWNLSPLGHLLKFLYTFIGPAGIGGTRQTYLQARLILQEHGMDAFNLDNFYGNPFGFGRILEESYNFDPTGLLTQQQWDQIQNQDSTYRNRAIDFMNAARAGTSPLGIYLAAKSGLGHDVEVIENYRYLYDQHSDDPIGVPYMGSSLSTEEVIILPRQDISQSEIQTVAISTPPAGGFFSLSVDGYTTQPIAPTATRLEVQAFLEALPNVGQGNVSVTGGPGPSVPWQINFIGALSGKSIGAIKFNNSLLTAQEVPNGIVTITTGGVEAIDETVIVSPKDQQTMMFALNQVKPVTSIITYNQASGVRSRTLWKSILASSEFTEVIRFITGTTNISGATNWIQANIENQAPKLSTGRTHHYLGFHHISKVRAYVEGGIEDARYETDFFDYDTYRSEHFGFFSPVQIRSFPFFDNPAFMTRRFYADRCVDPNPYSATFDDTTPSGDITMINEWYPADVYTSLYNPDPNDDSFFWASLERTSGVEYIEVDLGSVQAVNYVSFETTHKPFIINIEYDILGDPIGRRRFFPVSPSTTDPYETNITYSADIKHPWQFTEFNFSNNQNTMIYTRYLRISFTRNTANSPFQDESGNLFPFTADIRKLRVGRSVFIDDDTSYAPQNLPVGKPIYIPSFIGTT